MPVSIVIADDFPAFRTGLRTWLERNAEFKVVGEASDGSECVQLVRTIQPDILILDLHMPRLSGFQVLDSVREEAPRTRVILMAAHAEETCAVEAFRKGALAYILKSSSAEHTLDAVRAAARKVLYLGPPFAASSLTSILKQAEAEDSDPLETLTPREKEVLYLAARGSTSTEIAHLLHISPRTVEQHRARLMRKLHLRNLTGLIRFALQHGILSLED
jgi:DNA-binding NarL/FixJ family response regulator